VFGAGSKKYQIQIVFDIFWNLHQTQSKLISD